MEVKRERFSTVARYGDFLQRFISDYKRFWRGSTGSSRWGCKSAESRRQFSFLRNDEEDK